jgi:hypothetical protein
VVFSLKGIGARISEISLRGMLRIIFTSLFSNIMILSFCLDGVQLEIDQCAHLRVKPARHAAHMYLHISHF